MAIVLDEVTRAEYLAQTLASSRASLVVSALTGTVTCEVYDGSNVLRASGTMASPWATASGSTITIGEVNAAGISVSSGGAPDSLWYCQFRGANGRFVRGTFGVSTDTADFKWSLSSFQTGSRGTIGTATLTASGVALPVLLAAPVISGTTQVGLSLSLSTGTWQSDTTLSYARQWLRDGAAISGANGSTYTLTNADLGANIGGTVTATNSSGSTAASASPVGPVAAADDIAGLPLVYPSDLTYAGSFLPGHQYGYPFEDTWGGWSIDPTGNSGQPALYGVGGPIALPRMGKVTFATLQNMNSVAVGSLNRSTVLQYDNADPTNGTLANVAPGGTEQKSLQGTLVYGGKLYVSGTMNYVGGTAPVVASHWRRDLDITTTSASGPHTLQGSLDGSALSPRWFAATMCHIPTDWQSAFGAPVMVASPNCLSTNQSYSFGPGCGLVDPARIGVDNPAAVTTLLSNTVASPLENPAIGTPSPKGLWNASSNAPNVVCVPGTRAVLFIGTFGYGDYRYGSPDNTTWFDPAGASSGEHAYPYRIQVWAYDALDLLDVKNGTANAKDVRPYAVWDLPMVYGTRGVNDRCKGAVIDMTTRRLYVGQYGVDTNFSPALHAYDIGLNNGSGKPYWYEYPGITGTWTSGNALTCNGGAWGNSPSLSYQWQRSGGSNVTSWSNISGAASSSYTLAASDVGRYVRCVVTGTNGSGTASASSGCKYVAS